MDCPDLQIGKVISMSVLMGTYVHVLPHDRSKSDKLQYVSCDKQQSVKYFLLFTCCSAPSKYNDKHGNNAEHGEDKVDHVEW